MLDWLRFILTAGFLISGLLILITSVIGLYKFDYVLNRMHAAAMGDTLGILFCLLGLVISAPDVWVMLKLLLIIAFLWVASPVSSHLIARLEVTINPQWHQLPPPQQEEEEAAE
ncbi:MAG: monovalent cation/H(+) antiporter subunit G [Clostridiales bacterium]|jgi:multicomponent Na+:H+ antiporter subunit G|nr:monovalent cation/H(+) antiporter subunit G [Clostridiales bacterium]